MLPGLYQIEPSIQTSIFILHNRLYQIQIPIIPLQIVYPLIHALSSHHPLRPPRWLNRQWPRDLLGSEVHEDYEIVTTGWLLPSRLHVLVTVTTLVFIALFF